MKNKPNDMIEKLKRNSDSNNNSITDAVNIMTTVNPENNDMIKHVPVESLISSPLEWNFYKPLSMDKLMELVESIEENGLINPIIVWEKDDNAYMILAGHNRANAYRMLLEKTGDEKYLKIPTFVRLKDSLTEDEARAIIVDTNFVCRQLSTLEKAKSILVKYNELGSKKRNEINVAETIATQFDLNKRQIYRYYQLNKLIPEFINRIDNGTLSMKAALRLSKLTNSFQNTLFNEYNNILDNKTIMRIDITKTEDELLILLKKNSPIKLERLVLEVPSEYVEDIKKLLDNFLKERILR